MTYEQKLKIERAIFLARKEAKVEQKKARAEYYARIRRKHEEEGRIAL